MTDVRRGTVEDTKQVLDLLEEYHKTSNLSNIQFKRQHMAQTYNYYARAREGLVLVADTGDKIDGVLIATCEPYFFNAKKQFATDIMFVSNGHGVKMLRLFKEWAKAMGADRIIMGVSSENPRADAFLEVSGFNTTGAMYVFRCQGSQETL